MNLDAMILQYLKAIEDGKTAKSGLKRENADFSMAFLKGMTGQDFGDDTQKWREWIFANKDKWLK